MPSSRPNPDCFIPPNGVDDAHRAVRVDREDAGFERAGDAQRPGPVARPDGAGQPVGRVVGEPDGLLLVRERNHGRDRAEHLLARDPVVVRGLDERAREPEAAVAVRDSPRNATGVPSTNDATVSRCAAETSGPISVSSSAGSPTRTFAVA